MLTVKASRSMEATASLWIHRILCDIFHKSCTGSTGYVVVEGKQPEMLSTREAASQTKGIQQQEREGMLAGGRGKIMATMIRKERGAVRTEQSAHYVCGILRLAMVGLLGVGLALMLGIGVRIAAASGSAI